MSDVTAEYVDKFWELIDEVLNATICFNRPRATSNTYIPKNTFTAVIVLIIKLITRYISIYIPSIAVRLKEKSLRKRYLF
jgi:CPA1 family monovalent cation:H+ antiporter